MTNSRLQVDPEVKRIRFGLLFGLCTSENDLVLSTPPADQLLQSLGRLRCGPLAVSDAGNDERTPRMPGRKGFVGQRRRVNIYYITM